MGVETENLEIAEAKARSHGYAGAWPPPPRPRIDSAADLAGVIDGLAGGDGRANLAAQLAVHAAGFFDALPPDKFAAMARALIALAKDATTARRTRIRAVQAAIRPVIELIRRVKKLQKVRTTDQSLLHRLELSVAQFVGVFAEVDPESGKTQMVLLADLLANIATQAMGPKGREDQVRAIDTALRIVQAMMDVILDAQNTDHAPTAAAAVDPQRLAQAMGELRQWDAELQQGLQRGVKTVRATVTGQGKEGAQSDVFEKVGNGSAGAALAAGSAADG